MRPQMPPPHAMAGPPAASRSNGRTLEDNPFYLSYAILSRLALGNVTQTVFVPLLVAF